MNRSLPRTAAVFAVLLPLAGLAPAQPATAGPTSSTSNEVVYTVTDVNGAASIVLRDLATKVQTVPLHTSATTDYDTPELSPTGDRIVASYDTQTDTAEPVGITLVGRGGGTQTHLTTLDLFTDSAFDVEPTFAPDGNTVLFTRVTDTTPDAGTQTLSYTLYTVPAAGGTATALPGGDNCFAGSYDPTNANRVVCSKVTDTETGYGELSTVTSGTVADLGVTGNFAKFSPDGGTIAYSTRISASVDRIATIPAAGGSPTVFPSPVGGSSFAGVTAWLPDGESILFDLITGSGYALWAVDARGTRAGVVVPATATSDASGGHVNGPAPAPVQADASGSTFVPATPTRLLDTRTTNGGHQGKVPAGGSVLLQVTGRTLADSTTVPANATAVVLNVTAVNGTTPTVVRVYPAPASPVQPTSSLNTTHANQTLANQVTVKLPTTAPDLGKVVLYNGSGAIDLVTDITGYYVPGTASALYAPLDPRRILDTRNGTGAPAHAVGPGGTIDLTVVGASLPVSGGGTVAVPPNATAVVLNVTGTAPTTTTNIRVFPKPVSGSAVPLISSLNLVKDQTAPNLVTVKIGSGGKVRLVNPTGSVQLIADLAGYYSPDTSEADGVFVPVVPARFLDTRNGVGAAPIPTTANGFVDLLVRGTRGLPTGTALTGVVLNLTGTATSTSTVVRAYPATSGTPTVSNLNLVKGDSRANAVMVKPGTNGRVRILNGAGTMQLVADLSGYFLALP